MLVSWGEKSLSWLVEFRVSHTCKPPSLKKEQLIRDSRDGGWPRFLDQVSIPITQSRAVSSSSSFSLPDGTCGRFKGAEGRVPPSRRWAWDGSRRRSKHLCSLVTPVILPPDPPFRVSTPPLQHELRTRRRQMDTIAFWPDL